MRKGIPTTSRGGYAEKLVTQALDMYTNQPHRTVREIADELRVDPKTIHKWARDSGVPLRSLGRIPFKTRHPQEYARQREEALRLFEAGKSMEGIAGSIGRSPTAVSEMLKGAVRKRKAAPLGGAVASKGRGWKPGSLTWGQWKGFQGRHQTTESLKSIGAAFGVSIFTASRWAREAGLPVKPTASSPRGK